MNNLRNLALKRKVVESFPQNEETKRIKLSSVEDHSKMAQTDLQALVKPKIKS